VKSVYHLVEPTEKMNKTLVLRPEKCIGCRSCELICSFTRAKEFNPQKSSVTVIQYDKAMICVPIMCTQCEEAYCEKVCPVEAIYKDENGARVIDEKRCITCKMCMFACPLGNIAFDGDKVFKCNLCGGTPNCALHCPSGAIEYKEALPSTLLKRKAVADRFKEAFGEEE
jgi:carbon-monoxide dehydrogenase iron sulfur subunit